MLLLPPLNKPSAGHYLGPHRRAPPLPPKGFTVDTAPPGDLGAVLVGRQVFYHDIGARRRTPLPAPLPWPALLVLARGLHCTAPDRACQCPCGVHPVDVLHCTVALASKSLFDSYSYGASPAAAPATGIAAGPRASLVGANHDPIFVWMVAHHNPAPPSQVRWVWSLQKKKDTNSDLQNTDSSSAQQRLQLAIHRVACDVTIRFRCA
jgi:hypothetical protein